MWPNDAEWVWRYVHTYNFIGVFYSHYKANQHQKLACIITTYIITIDLTQNLVLVAPVHAFNMWPMIRTSRYMYNYIQFLVFGIFHFKDKLQTNIKNSLELPQHI